MKHPILKNLTVYNSQPLATLNGIFEGKIITHDDMYQFLAHDVASVVSTLEFAMCKYKVEEESVLAFETKKVDETLKQVIAALTDLELPESALAAQEALDGISRWRLDKGEKPMSMPKSMRAALGQIVLEIRKELRRRYFLALEQDEQYLYSTFPVTEERIVKSFPFLHYDFSEALKCLVLGRYTASGMHCMRIMELVVEELGKKAKVPLFDSSTPPKPMGWHKIVEGVESKVNKFHPGSNKSKIIFRDDLAEALRHLMLVKFVRNALQHPRNKLLKEEATSCYEGTKNFVMLLESKNLLRKTAIHLK